MNKQTWNLLAALVLATVAAGCATVAGSLISGGSGSLSGEVQVAER